MIYDIACEILQYFQTENFIIKFSNMNCKFIAYKKLEDLTNIRATCTDFYEATPFTFILENELKFFQ